MPHTDVVRDPIHQLISLNPAEWQAVNSRVFQRLRGIGQLALTHMVYPGARHSRFEHSLGVRHVAGLVCSKLNLQGEDRDHVLAAALLHDVGHGPFSHVSEQVLDDVSGTRGVHEAISIAIMRTNSELREALGDLCDGAADLVAGTGGRSVLTDIVSGPTDADKLDYLLRDSYFAGVEYGKYDLPRVIDSVARIGNPAAQTYLGFKHDGLWAVEGLLLARHHMHRQVYGHKTRLATDIMVVRALLAGIAEGLLDPAAYTVPLRDGLPAPNEAFLERFLAETDSSVLETLRHAPEGSVSRDLYDRLAVRRLLRQTETVVMRRSNERLDPLQMAAILDPQQFTRDRAAALEAEIAAELDLPPHLVAIYRDTWSNPTYRRPGTRIDSKDILLQRGDRVALLQDESEIFRAEQGEEHNYVYLYAPAMEEAKTEQAKELLWEKLGQI
jgi:uncharacterized protein